MRGEFQGNIIDSKNYRTSQNRAEDRINNPHKLPSMEIEVVKAGIYFSERMKV